MNTYTCARPLCGLTITLAAAVEQNLRDSHETFYCPAGHSQSFAGKSKLEKRAEEAERMRDRFRESWSEALDQVAELRVEARTCPFCSLRLRTKRRMVEHLADEHGASRKVRALIPSRTGDAS